MLFLLAPLSISAVGIAQGSLDVVLIGLFIGVFAYFPFAGMLATLWGSASSVTVADDYIEARNYVGRRTRLMWEQVVERREFEADTALYGGNREKQVRLIAADGRTIAIAGFLPGFDELYTIIRDKTRHARQTGDTRNWWQRLIKPA